MSTTQIITNPRCRQIIEESIQRRVHVVLTYRGAEGWRTYKSQFAAGPAPHGALVVVVERAGESAPAPPVGQTVGVSFRLGHKKCMFSSTVRSLESAQAGLLVTLLWPESIQQLQRRAFERVAPPSGTVIAVRFWPTDETGGERQVRHGQLEDLSAGGMRLKVADAAQVVPGGAYQCVFAHRPGAAALLLEATLLHREAADQRRASLGFHFIGLETTPEGRLLLDRLARIVSQFQRVQAHRTDQPTRSS